jgi:hypothetical protein
VNFANSRSTIVAIAGKGAKCVDRSHSQAVCASTCLTEKKLPAAGGIFDENVLTLRFARRFATYEASNLLLHDPERFVRLLSDPKRPVQLASPETPILRIFRDRH